MDITEQIHERVPLSDVIGEHITLRRRGRSITGLCPFHNDSKPSLQISDEKGIFKCFSCGMGGDVIKFLMEYQKISFREAVTQLAKKYQLTLPANFMQRQDDAGTPKVDAYLEAKAINAFVATIYHKYLLEHPKAEPARVYLKQRGVAAGAIQAFKLGYAPRGRNLLSTLFTRPAFKGRFSKKALLQTNLFQAAASAEKNAAPSDEQVLEYDFFSHRIVFPIFNEKNDVLGFGGRALDDHPAKYLNSRESPYFLKHQVLYGIHESYQLMVQSREVFVVEGYLDVIAMQSVQLPAVAPLGTAVTLEHLQKLKRYVRKVHFLFDGDAAGKRAAFNASALAAALELDGAVYTLPAGSDPFDFIFANHGNLDKLMAYFKTHSANLYDYLITGDTGKSPSARSPVEQQEALEQLMPVYLALQRPVIKNVFKNKLLAAFGTDPDTLSANKRFTSLLKTASARTWGGAPRRVSPKTAAPVAASSSSVPAASPFIGRGRQLIEEELILLLAKHPRLLANAASVLYVQDFASPRARVIYEKIVHLKNDPNPLPMHVLDLFKNQEVIAYLLHELMAEGDAAAASLTKTEEAEQQQLAEQKFEELYCRFKLLQLRDRKLQLHKETAVFAARNDEVGLRAQQEKLLLLDAEKQTIQAHLSKEQIFSNSTTAFHAAPKVSKQTSN